MKARSDETAEKLRGGYYTEPDLADFLLRWTLEIDPHHILEPACGDGAFITKLADLEPENLERFTGFEIVPEEAEKSRQAAEEFCDVEVEIHARDFLSWSVKKLMGPSPFDAVVGNPPFIRYQYWDDRLEAHVPKIFDHFDLRFTRHTNAWVPFVIASLALLRRGGRLAMVVPAEILHVLHAGAVRSFLTSECSRVLLFDPREIWFEETLQGAQLLLAEKKEHSDEDCRGVAIVPTDSRDFLREDPESFFRAADFANGATVEGKWMQALLTAQERELLNKLREDTAVHRFEDIADVDVGIVTGANRFFLVTDETVRKHGLEPWAYPMFGRSDHVSGVIYDEAAHQENREAGRRTNFIWFTDEQQAELPESVQKYLAQGEEDELHKRYKCRIRDPWYAVPSVHSTPVGMLKRSHDYPRLFWNKMEAFTTDTAYRIQPKKDVMAGSLVGSFVNSLTVLCAELEGRHYGGGVLELVPSEIEELLVPLVEFSEEELEAVDDQFRKGEKPQNILKRQDRKVLGKLGLSRSDQATLRNAWLRLRNRRQRN